MASNKSLKLGLKYLKALERHESKKKVKAIIVDNKTIVKGNSSGDQIKKIFDLNNEEIKHCKEINNNPVVITRNSAFNSSIN